MIHPTEVMVTAQSSGPYDASDSHLSNSLRATKPIDIDPNVVDRVLKVSRLSRIGTLHATEVTLSVAEED